MAGLEVGKEVGFTKFTISTSCWSLVTAGGRRCHRPPPQFEPSLYAASRYVIRVVSSNGRLMDHTGQDAISIDLAMIHVSQSRLVFH
jgi:hypothetical protein